MTCALHVRSTSYICWSTCDMIFNIFKKYHTLGSSHHTPTISIIPFPYRPIMPILIEPSNNYMFVEYSLAVYICWLVTGSKVFCNILRVITQVVTIIFQITLLRTNNSGSVCTNIQTRWPDLRLLEKTASYIVSYDKLKK